jgi:hypothetical protein
LAEALELGEKMKKARLDVTVEPSGADSRDTDRETLSADRG